MASPRVPVLGAAAAAIWLVIALTARQLGYERELAAESVMRENQFRVQSFEQYVLRTLEVAELATRHVDYITRQSPAMRSPDLLIADQTIRSPVFTTIIINRGNLGVLSTNPAVSVDPATNARLLAIALRVPGRLTVTAPLRVTGMRSQVAVVRDLPAVKGGYVAIFIDPRRFTQFAEDVPFAQDDLISLIGLDGITRARRTGSVLSAGEVVSGLVMKRQLAAPYGTYLGPSVLDGIPRYFSHRRLTRFNLFVTSGMPASLITERIAQRRWVQLGIMTAALLAIISAALVLLSFIRRRQLQLDQLTRSNRQLNEAQRIGSMGDWDYYPATNNLHWSENLRRMYGRTDSEAVSSLSEVGRYVPEGAASRVYREIERILKTGERASWEVDAVLATGERSSRRIVATPIFGEQGTIIGIHGTDHDITNETKLRSLEHRLVELARLDSMRALAATFAHELNQPLGAAANYLGAATRTLAASPAVDAKVIEYLDAAKDQIDHIGQIIEGARELVTHSGSNAQLATVSEVIDSVIMLLRATDGARQARFHTDIAPGAENIRANVAQLKQVLFNLSRNAIESVPASRFPSIAFSVGLNPEGLTQFEVTDNGGGFITSDKDPFAALSTTKESGLGLGLSLARTIVEAHGGRIWIKHSGPHGATLAFTLQSSDEIKQ